MKLITTSPRAVYYVDIEGVRYILNKTLTGKQAINVLCEDCNLFFYRSSDKTWIEVASDKPAAIQLSKPLNQAFKILRKLKKQNEEFKFTQSN